MAAAAQAIIVFLLKVFVFGLHLVVGCSVGDEAWDSRECLLPGRGDTAGGIASAEEQGVVDHEVALEEALNMRMDMMQTRLQLHRQFRGGGASPSPSSSLDVDAALLSLSQSPATRGAVKVASSGDEGTTSVRLDDVGELVEGKRGPTRLDAFAPPPKSDQLPLLERVRSSAERLETVAVGATTLGPQALHSAVQRPVLPSMAVLSTSDGFVPVLAGAIASNTLRISCVVLILATVFAGLLTCILNTHKPSMVLKAADALVAVGRSTSTPLEFSLEKQKFKQEHVEAAVHWDSVKGRSAQKGIRPPKGWGDKPAAGRTKSRSLGGSPCEPCPEPVPEVKRQPKSTSSKLGANPPLPALYADGWPQTGSSVLCVPLDPLREHVNAFDVIDATGTPVLHVAVRGQDASRRMEIFKAPERRQVLASTCVMQRSPGESTETDSARGFRILDTDAVEWGSLLQCEHGGFALMRAGSKIAVANESTHGDFRLLSSADACVASGKLCSCEKVLTGAQHVEIDISEGIDPILTLCCMLSPILLRDSSD